MTSQLPRLDRHVPRCGPLPSPGSRQRTWRRFLRAAALVAVHLLVLVHLAHWKVSGRTMTPLEPSESMQTLELGYLNAGFLLFVALLLLTLVVGRFFCGWACHVVAYQDLCAWLLGRFGLRPRPLRARLLRLVPIGAAFYMFAWPTLSRWWQGGAARPLQAHLTTDQFWRTFPGPWMAALTILVDGALVVWWLGAKGFCTFGCPYGALFGLADRFASGRIRVNDSCEGCGHCTAVCTSNVRVHEEVARFGMVVDPGCMKCLDCVRSCPKEALSVGFGRPSLWRGAFHDVGGAGGVAGVESKSMRPSLASDLSWPEELLSAAVFLAALFAFWGLYSKVPFLLSIGLSALAAVAAIALKRQLAQRDFQLQWASWRVAGRFTARGIAGTLLAVAFLAFVTQSALVRHHERAGDAAFERFNADPRDAGAAADAAAHLESALELGLFPDGKTQNLLAIVEQRTGHPERALPHLRRAIEIEPTATRWTALARLLAELGQPDAAREAMQNATRSP